MEVLTPRAAKGAREELQRSPPLPADAARAAAPPAAARGGFSYIAAGSPPQGGQPNAAAIATLAAPAPAVVQPTRAAAGGGGGGGGFGYLVRRPNVQVSATPQRVADEDGRLSAVTPPAAAAARQGGFQYMAAGRLSSSSSQPAGSPHRFSQPYADPNGVHTIDTDSTSDDESHPTTGPLVTHQKSRSASRSSSSSA